MNDMLFWGGVGLIMIIWALEPLIRDIKEQMEVHDAKGKDSQDPH